MTLPEDIQNRISKLNKRLRKCVSKLNNLEDDDYDDEHYEIRDKYFISVFRNTSALIREAETANAPYLPELLEAAQQLIDEAIGVAYGERSLYDFMPSWAHDDEGGRPLVKDRGRAVVGLAFDPIVNLMSFLGMHGGAETGLRPTLNPWLPSMKRHPKTSPLARFRPELPTLTPTSTSPLATIVYDARCDVSSASIISPINLQLSLGSTFLAVNGMCGFKHRSPGLECFLLDKGDDESTGFVESKFVLPGLAHIAVHLATDESRKLVFVGDKYRVKSYKWAAPDGTYHDEPFPTHTLDSGGSSGPIAILPNGTLIRASTGGADVWTLDSLPTHGSKGRKIIGQKMDDYDLDTWRDDSEDIELSTGTPSSSRINFVDQLTLSPSVWQPLIESPSTVLCGDSGGRYGCTSVDMEHGGKTVARYIGHGGYPTDFSVSAGDPRVFLTACNDGFARLYDVRQALPASTFDACGEAAFCEAAVLAHLDGIPTVFTGSGKQEQIKMWDVRARAAVYELATGNNAVTSLAWDAKHHCLYAATECSYKDRLGFRHDYRPAMIPRRGRRGHDDEDDYRCWPEQAWHSEDYFEYAFDAGDHRIYRYVFKENPDTSKVPEYGDAREGEFENFW